ncbi:MAG: hypothetical protein ACREBD_15265 [Blastocatellia bacterium]
MKVDPQWATPYLLEAFNDNYPIVRFFAAQGLANYNRSLPKLDYITNAGRRAGSEARLITNFGAGNEPVVPGMVERGGLDGGGFTARRLARLQSASLSGRSATARAFPVGACARHAAGRGAVLIVAALGASKFTPPRAAGFDNLIWPPFDIFIWPPSH